MKNCNKSSGVCKILKDHQFILNFYRDTWIRTALNGNNG